MLPEQLKPNAIIRGPLFPEPVQIVAAKHVNTGNLKLTVGVTIQPEAGFSITQIEEIEASLRELGLQGQ